MSVLLGGGPSIPVRYGGKYEDWFLLVEISSVLLGGGRSIQLSCGGGYGCYCTPRKGDCQRRRKETFPGRGTVFLENRGLAVYTNLVIVCKCERGEPYLP